MSFPALATEAAMNLNLKEQTLDVIENKDRCGKAFGQCQNVYENKYT